MYMTLSRPPLIFLFLSVVGFVFSGCGFGESGITPPSDRLFLPTGMAADPDTDFLYVVNSNSDLRYNAGTLIAVDLTKVLASVERYSDRTSYPLPSCGKTRFSREEKVAANYCCRDVIDTTTVNCHERQFIQEAATVQIGSFGGSVVLQPFEKNGVSMRRLYMAVRAEPSITYADVRLQSGQVSIRCTGSRTDETVQPAHAFCDDNWRIRRPAGATVGSFVLSEEPHRLLLDSSQSALYIGHLTVTANNMLEGGGISTIDVCHPELPTSPRFAGQARIVFPDKNSQSVGALSLSPEGPINVFATARYSPEISGLVFRSGQSACPADASEVVPRELSLVPSEYFLSAAFLPAGTDVRGILFSDDNLTAYILHRDAPDLISNPSALVAIDRRIREDGSRSNQPIGILKVCNGPSEMVAHDAGYGKRLYVTCYDDAQIYVIDPHAWRVEAIIDVGRSPASLVFLPLHPTVAVVASFTGNHLSVIDLDWASPTRHRVVHRIGLPYGYGE